MLSRQLHNKGDDISTTLGLQLIAYENITAMLTLADIHMEQGDFEQAAATYRHIVELQPNTTAKYNLGNGIGHACGWV